VLIKSIQEQQAQINILKNNNGILQIENEKLKASISEIEILKTEIDIINSKLNSKTVNK
jgi:regulator of replication initiation timing